jgi:hypothetical protein
LARTAAQTSFTALAPASDWELKYHLVQAAGEAPKVKLGPATDLRPSAVAQAPAGLEFQHAAQWAIELPPGSMQGLSELFLKVRYTGDVARLYSSGSLLTDNFYNGQPWSVGLSRFLDTARANRIMLDVLPLRADAPIYVQSPKRPTFDEKGQAVQLEDLELEPEYQLVIDAHAR